MDGPLAVLLVRLFDTIAIAFVKFGAVVLLTPVFLIPGILVLVIGAWCGRIYINAQLPVKREMSNAKAPILDQYVVFQR